MSDHIVILNLKKIEMIINTNFINYHTNFSRLIVMFYYGIEYTIFSNLIYDLNS